MLRITVGGVRKATRSKFRNDRVNDRAREILELGLIRKVVGKHRAQFVIEADRIASSAGCCQPVIPKSTENSNLRHVIVAIDRCGDIASRFCRCSLSESSDAAISGASDANENTCSSALVFSYSGYASVVVDISQGSSDTAVSKAPETGENERSSVVPASSSRRILGCSR